MSCPTKTSIAFRRRKGRAFALVVTLAMLVLVAGLITAYFSRTLQEQRVGRSSSSFAEADLLARTAVQVVLGDFISEMEAGSETDQDDFPFRVLKARWAETDWDGVSFAPSAVPQRAGASAAQPNVVKVSRAAVPFFMAGEGYDPEDENGPARASSISTETPSTTGRAVAPANWNDALLMTPGEFNTFGSPDWIYINRAGNNPTEFDPEALLAMASSEPTNPDYVLGRFAYVAYDLGGLLDVNVAGNALPTPSAGSETWDKLIGRKNRLHQVNLQGELAGIEIPGYNEFVTDWRWPVQGHDNDGLFSPENTFLNVVAGDQAFPGRRDLIQFASQPDSPIPADLLPLLTVFSRDLNAPQFQAEPARPKTPSNPDPDEMNPPLLEVRFAEPATLRRDGDNSIDVEAGTPVMPRRFPLSKIALLEEDTPDPDAVEYYFGLTQTGDRQWAYTAGIEVFQQFPWGPGPYEGTRIARLDEVADQGREPNFFEILQAVIYTGSLGKAAANTYGYEATGPSGGPGPDSLQNLQVMRIGANIIDQWIGDDIATRIEFPSGVQNDPFLVFGTVNLPYISQISVVPYRPPYNPELLQVWAVFDVWNPHQNARTPPVGVDQLRIIPVSGRGQAHNYYRAPLSGSRWNTTWQTPGLPPGRSLPTQHTVPINQNRDPFTFPAGDDYSEPTRLGNPPDSTTASAGVLLLENEVPPAVPPYGLRSAELQEALNFIMENHGSSYEASESYTKDDATGERIYPAGTTFTNFDTNAWRRTDDNGEIRIGAEYGVKGHNYLRLWPNTSDPYVFDLQARVNGQWRTYQRVEGWFRQSDGPQEPMDGSTPAMLTNTYPTEPIIDPERSWNTWMSSHGGSAGMQRPDPRTFRFGSSGVNAWTNFPSNSDLNDFTGYSVRSSTDPIPEVGPNTITEQTRRNENWIAGTGNHQIGGGNAPGFERVMVRQYVGSFISYAFGLISNHPEILNHHHPMRYSDPDGIIRPGDGYLGGHPTVPGHRAERPLILNRPFRNVGEMGYAFRDMPWKTLDFFSRHSGDLGLLEAFSVEAPEEPAPLVAGKLSLNTRRTEVLAKILENSSKQLAETDDSVSSAYLSSDDAMILAEAIVAESSVRPFLSRGEVVTRMLDHPDQPPALNDLFKTHREATARTLSEIGTTRTWNLMFDVVAQSGRFISTSQTGADFMVTGEVRYWVHAAIDRGTGQILELHTEVIHE